MMEPLRPTDSFTLQELAAFFCIPVEAVIAAIETQRHNFNKPSLHVSGFGRALELFPAEHQLHSPEVRRENPQLGNRKKAPQTARARRDSRAD
jgi:hypothetical protein